MRLLKILSTLLLALALATNLPVGSAAPSNPMGVNWGVNYGIGTASESFMPQARKLGASFSRVILYWSQLEPKDGVSRWTDLDAYLAQISSPDEAILTLSSSSPWATRTKTWVFPSSPATDPERYAQFVQAAVEHTKGKIRYFQNGNEPNSPFFWSGTAEEYAAQQRLFYQAVKRADPSAIVILGGCDGLFDPSGEDPFPGQEADIAFWKKVISAAAGAFDVFDIHLYGNPYTIPGRVDAVRAMMRESGGERPIWAGEYHGPGFFEFKANRRWWRSLQGPEANAESVRRLRAQDAELPQETRMFLAPENSADAARLTHFQAIDLVVRNFIALSNGIERTAFFDLWHDTANSDAPNVVLDGKFKLLEHDAKNVLATELPLAAAFRRLAAALNGAVKFARVDIPGQAEVYAYEVERKGREPLLVAWRRARVPGSTVEAAPVSLAWKHKAGAGATIEGAAVKLEQKKQVLSFAVAEVPVLIGVE